MKALRHRRAQVSEQCQKLLGAGTEINANAPATPPAGQQNPAARQAASQMEDVPC
ncbi:hypothetical protein [Paraburkholderia caledonica]|uniref:Uncharacterized protein n=1 Tax=Paraburkholderia caledonica TaxID=134536 RepID=A0AB73IKK4_9BURK|nr:hypothetical protein [Paraburkholderia caledonica]